MRRYLQNIAKHYGLADERIQSIDFDMLEFRINEYFSKAHSFYLRAVKDHQMDYGIYNNAFFVLLEMVEQRHCIKDDLISQFAYGIVKHALTKREDRVRMYFETYPIGNYCGLLKVILGDKYVSNMSGRDDKRIVNKAPAQMVAAHGSEALDKKDSNCDSSVQESLLLQASVSDKAISDMAHFVNKEKLFNRHLSMEDMKDFFNNKMKDRLKMMKNNLAAFFFHQLSQQSFIKNEWASIMACNRMLVSSSGSEIVDAHNLTVAACKIARKPVNDLKEKELQIYNFVRGLKFD